jgi:hypothetical protein
MKKKLETVAKRFFDHFFHLDGVLFWAQAQSAGTDYGRGGEKTDR